MKRQPDWKKHLPGQLEIPMVPELEKHLLSLASVDDPNASLCSKLAARGTAGNRGLSAQFQRIMESASVYSGIEKSGQGRQFRTLGFHSLRHTFVSELANANIPADVRRQISGHSDEEIHDLYTHLDVETKRRALSRLRPLASSCQKIAPGGRGSRLESFIERKSGFLGEKEICRRESDENQQKYQCRITTSAGFVMTLLRLPKVSWP